MGLRSSPLRADLMSAFSLGNFNSLAGLQLHASRSNLYRLPATSRVGAQRLLPSPAQSLQALVTTFGNKQKYSEGGRSKR